MDRSNNQRQVSPWTSKKKIPLENYENFINQASYAGYPIKHTYSDGSPLASDDLDRAYSTLNEQQAFHTRDMQQELLGKELVKRIPGLNDGSGQQAFERVSSNIYPGLTNAARELGVGHTIESLSGKDYDEKYNDGGGLMSQLGGNYSAGMKHDDGVSLRENDDGDRSADVGVMTHELGHMHDDVVEAYHNRKFKRSLDDYNTDGIPNPFQRLMDARKDHSIEKAVTNYGNLKPVASPYFKKPELSEIKRVHSEMLPPSYDGVNEIMNKTKSPIEIQRDFSDKHHYERNFSEDNLKRLLRSGNPLDVVNFSPYGKRSMSSST